MNGYQAVSVVSEALVRAKIDPGKAIAELRACVFDPAARENFDDLLLAWASVVLGKVTADDPSGRPVGSGLNYRQTWALKLAERNGVVTIRDMIVRWKTYSREALRLDLAAMVEKGLLVAVGEKRSRIYRYPQQVGNGQQENVGAAGNGEGVSEGVAGAAENDLLDSLTSSIPEGNVPSQRVASSTGSRLSYTLRRIMMTLSREGVRWLERNGHKYDAVRSSGSVFVLPGGAAKFQLCVFPELVAKVLDLEEVLEYELQADVTMEASDGNTVFITVQGVCNE